MTLWTKTRQPMKPSVKPHLKVLRSSLADNLRNLRQMEKCGKRYTDEYSMLWGIALGKQMQIGLAEQAIMNVKYETETKVRSEYIGKNI